MIESVRFAEISELNSDLLELPYANENITMVILLPKEGYSITEVENKMKRFDTKLFEPRLEVNAFSEVEIQLPRFEVSFEWKGVSKHIKEEGVRSLFDELSADLSEIADEKLYVTKVNENDRAR